MAAGQGIGRVDIAVASDAERGGVRLASEAGGCLLAHFAHPHPLVARPEFASGMHFGITPHAEKSRIRAAEE